MQLYVLMVIVNGFSLLNYSLNDDALKCHKKKLFQRKN